MKHVSILSTENTNFELQITSIHNTMSPKVLTFLLCLLFFSTIQAQNNSADSLEINKPIKKKETVEVAKKHSPTKATIYSAVVPGLGQAYNKKYWKIPVIYGLGGFLVYNISSSNSLYKGYRDALYARQDDDELTIDNTYQNLYSDSQLITRKDFYKRKRDINIIYALLLYTANIIDATVDAHLMHFEVGEKYIMTLEPTFLPTASVSNSIGLSLKLNFR